MAKDLSADVVIVGGGLTGLVTAFYLKRAGKNVYVIEKSSRPGGVINTMHEEGFALEMGPNSGVLSHPEAVSLFEDLDGLCKLEVANKESKKRLIWKGGAWHALPSGLINAITTPLFSFKDKLRILGEPFRKKGSNPDESVAGLVLRRLGKSFLDYAVDPFVSGIYAGNPHKIITRHALPKLYNLEQDYGSFIGGSVKKMREPKPADAKKATREVFSAENGLKSLIDALVKSIGSDRIFLNCYDVSVDTIRNTYEAQFKSAGEKYIITSPKLVTTTGGYALPDLLPFIPKDKMKAIDSLEYAKVVQVALGYKQWKGITLDAFGGLVPSVENRKILGVLFSSSIFRNRAPKGGALLSVFMGGMRNPDAINMSDDEIKSIVLGEVEEMMKPNQQPDLIKIFRYPYAIPQYEVSSGDRFREISEIEQRYPGLILAGNIRNGIGMADRIKQARTIADQIISESKK